MITVRIVPGDFGHYTGKGGSWNPDNPEIGTFEVELLVLPVKGSAVLFMAPEAFKLGHVQEVVVSNKCIYVFVPVSVAVSYE